MFSEQMVLKCMFKKKVVGDTLFLPYLLYFLTWQGNVALPHHPNKIAQPPQPNFGGETIHGL
jgi:hypothetical protein